MLDVGCRLGCSSIYTAARSSKDNVIEAGHNLSFKGGKYVI